jgi:hypothetical protein
LTNISREVLTIPGLLPVVHVIVVVVEADTIQGIPSMMTVLSSFVGEKDVPVNVTSVPPGTLPNLGSIEVKSGVAVP